MKDKISRRKFITGVGMLALGTSFSKLVGCTSTTTGGLISNAEARSGSAEKWPWPYEKLDPEKTAELAYNEWYRVFCGAAVISSIFSQLREKIGEPYKSFPIDAFVYMEGGMTGWGTICGSEAGAAVVTNIIIGPRIAGSKDGAMMGSEIMQWYSETPLPFYIPKEPKIKTEIIKTTSNSPLCHVSVGGWMKAANKSLGSAERKDRCARLTASVAYHTVTLLNTWKDGKYQTKGTLPAGDYGIPAQHNCTSCHSSNIPTPPMKK